MLGLFSRFRQKMNMGLGQGQSTAQNWQKWKGKVLGSDQDIERAVAKLGGQPKDSKELQEAIAQQRAKEIEKTQKASTNSYY